MNREEFERLKLQNKLCSSSDYQTLRDLQLKMILELANSNIEPLELKGMLKLLAKTDNWKIEYEKAEREINK